MNRFALLAAGFVSLAAPIAAQTPAPASVAVPSPPAQNELVPVALETSLAPEALLAALHAIERAQGRRRGQRWGARTIDLDLVRYGQHRIRTTSLVLPHPGLASRDFWRRELAELARALGEAA